MDLYPSFSGLFIFGMCYSNDTPIARFPDSNSILPERKIVSVIGMWSRWNVEITRRIVLVERNDVKSAEISPVNEPVKRAPAQRKCVDQQLPNSHIVSLRHVPSESHIPVQCDPSPSLV